MTDYPYICLGCATETTLACPMGKAPGHITCPSCGSKALRVYEPVDFKFLIQGKGYINAKGQPTGKRHPADPPDMPIKTGA